MACQLDGEMLVKIFCSDFSIGYNSLHAHLYIHSKIFVCICTFEVIKNHFFVDLSRLNSILQFILDLQTGWLNLSLLRERKMEKKKRKYRVLCFEIKKNFQVFFVLASEDIARVDRISWFSDHKMNEQTNERANMQRCIASYQLVLSKLIHTHYLILAFVK